MDWIISRAKQHNSEGTMLIYAGCGAGLKVYKYEDI